MSGLEKLALQALAHDAASNDRDVAATILTNVFAEVIRDVMLQCGASECEVAALNLHSAIAPKVREAHLRWNYPTRI
jgi:hypothetical protein